MLSLREVIRRMAGPMPPAVDPEAYSFLRSVWKTYPRAAAAWRAVVQPDQPTAERWAGLALGTPLLDESIVQWDAAPLRQQCRRLFRIFDSPSVSRSNAFGGMPRFLNRDDREPINWARSFLGAAVGDPRPELVIGSYVIQPFLYVYARRVLPRVSREGWRRNRCPVCGGGPFHGYLDPESRRKVLICGKCLCPWTTPRLQCPFCDNTLQEQLGYVFQEQAPRLRIEYCKRCRSVLPVTLESESTRPFPLHDHLASMPLQVAVERSSHDAQPS